MENAASTAFYFPSYAAFYQTKQNETLIVTVALFFQKIWLKTPNFGSHFEFTVQTGCSYNYKGICVPVRRTLTKKTLISSLSSEVTEL